MESGIWQRTRWARLFVMVLPGKYCTVYNRLGCRIQALFPPLWPAWIRSRSFYAYNGANCSVLLNASHGNHHHRMQRRYSCTAYVQRTAMNLMVQSLSKVWYPREMGSWTGCQRVLPNRQVSLRKLWDFEFRMPKQCVIGSSSALSEMYWSTARRVTWSRARPVTPPRRGSNERHDT